MSKRRLVAPGHGAASSDSDRPGAEVQRATGDESGTPRAGARLASRLAAPLVAALVIGGCAAPERELADQVPDYVTLTNGGHPDDPTRPSGVQQRYPGGILVAKEAELGRSLAVLEISGGGQNGAFGAGVLVGWSESGQRPRFDVVTGISVGALLSTFAFLGEPQDDATLKEVFTTVSKDDIYWEKSKLSIAFGGNSLMDSEPLGKLIALHVNDEHIDRVAQAGREGRSLFVGVLNVDYQQLWVFDMTALAGTSDPERYEIYRKILLAAASPPIVFPPVEIGGFLFVDGGTRDRLLVPGLNRDPRAPRPAGPGSGDVYVLFNDKQGAEPRAVRADIKGLVSSSVKSMLNGQMEATLVRAFGASQSYGVDFHLMQIPEDLEIGKDELAFDTAEMTVMFEAGAELGRDPASWLNAPMAGQTITPWVVEVLSDLGR